MTAGRHYGYSLMSLERSPAVLLLKIMNDWENIISFENLYKAHRRARLSKRHKKEVVLFENNLSENLWTLRNELKNKSYLPGGYHSFMIYDPKEREIQAISYRDRVVQHSLCDNFLMPLLEKHLIYDNAACRKNKGSGFAIARLKEFMTRHYRRFGKGGYFVKVDIKKYFINIDHGILKDILRKMIDDEDILWLLTTVIDSYNPEENKGLPMGNQSSQCFALLYLNGLDRFIKEKLRVKFYIRYMDDMILLLESRDRAADCLKSIDEFVLRLKLQLNCKSQIIAAKNGIEFLGWRFSFDRNGKTVQKLKRSAKKRMLKKIKLELYKIKCSRSTKDKQCMKSSYMGYLKSGNCRFFCNQVSVILSDNV